MNVVSTSSLSLGLPRFLHLWKRGLGLLATDGCLQNVALRTSVFSLRLAWSSFATTGDASNFTTQGLRWGWIRGQVEKGGFENGIWARMGITQCGRPHGWEKPAGHNASSAALRPRMSGKRNANEELSSRGQRDAQQQYSSAQQQGVGRPDYFKEHVDTDASIACSVTRTKPQHDVARARRLKGWQPDIRHRTVCNASRPIRAAQFPYRPTRACRDATQSEQMHTP